MYAALYFFLRRWRYHAHYLIDSGDAIPHLLEPVFKHWYAPLLAGESLNFVRGRLVQNEFLHLGRNLNELEKSDATLIARTAADITAFADIDGVSRIQIFCKVCPRCLHSLKYCACRDAVP